MTVVEAYIRSLAVPLSVPYTIAYETITDVVNHFLVLRTDAGITGIGCAAPAEEVTGESVEESLGALRDFCQQVSGRSLEDIPHVAARYPSARTAVDLALHDIRARAASTNIAGMFGSSGAIKAERITSVTIGIMPVQETIERTRQCLEEGFRFLKVKGGHDVRVDLDRLSALRAEFGDEVLLALDANQGYSLSDVAHLDAAADTLHLQYLEQPTPKSDLELLSQAGRTTSIPVMADESVQTTDDVRAIGERGSVSLINIKLQKMGGLASAHAIDSAASEYGVRTMLGCMDESALSIAAAIHFGATHPNVAFYDLDGHFDLTDDPFRDLVTLRHGCLKAIKGNGLGWTTIPESICS